MSTASVVHCSLILLLLFQSKGVLLKANRPFYCQLCRIGYLRRFAWERHMKRYHSADIDARIYVCELCDKRYGTKEAFDGHFFSVHAGLKHFTCDICKKEFTYKENLAHHKANIHKFGLPPRPVDLSVK